MLSSPITACFKNDASAFLVHMQSLRILTHTWLLLLLLVLIKTTSCGFLAIEEKVSHVWGWAGSRTRDCMICAVSLLSCNDKLHFVRVSSFSCSFNWKTSKGNDSIGFWNTEIKKWGGESKPLFQIPPPATTVWFSMKLRVRIMYSTLVLEVEKLRWFLLTH